MFTYAIIQSFSYPSTIEGYTFDLDGGFAGAADFTYPAGILENDLIIAALDTSENGATTWSTPSGYTKLHEENGAGLITAIEYKVALGTESGAISFSSNGSGRKAALLWVIRGADPAAPINDWSVFVDAAPGTPNDFEVSDVTTTKSGCRGIVFAMCSGSGTAGKVVVPMTDYTEINNSGNGTYPYVAGSTVDNVGGIGTYGGTVNWTGTSISSIHNYFLAIAPA